MEKSILKNGLTILSDNNPHTRSATISVFIGAGSYHELNYPTGIAHFIEHLMFKGTKNRSYKKINEDIDQIGGVLNAYTTYERTKYYCMVPYDQWKVGTDILLDMMVHHTIPSDEFEKEKQVVLEEIKMYEDDPASLSFDILNELMHQDYPERQSIIGTPDSVLSITRDDVFSFISHFYTPENMTIVATGRIEHEELVNYIDGFLFPASSPAKHPISTFVQRKMNGEHFIEKDIQQAHMTFGLFGPAANNDDAYAMKVLTNLLGGSSSSRLYQSIREDRGLAYSVSLSYSVTSDNGVIEGYVGTERENVEEIKILILSEFEKLKSSFVAKDELERSINYTTGIFMLSMDNHSSLNDFYGANLLLGQSLDIDEHIEKIKKVTSEDIMRVANTYLQRDNLIFMNIVPK